VIEIPAKNRRQQRALYAKFGAAWVKAHHFDRIAGQKKKRKKTRRKRRKG
jgi:glutamyl/glutaminyl-tRNA synthetase